jgi:SAM-dependent methyltransferase
VVRFNTDRSNRLAFDDVAVDYRTRPDVPQELIGWCLGAAGMTKGDEILEVGAGTGQLTAGLLDAGAVVTAIEPGTQLRAVLARRFAGNPGLSIEGGYFEDLSPDRTFSGVWSANAFHWLDPMRAIRVAHDALGPGRSLVLIWTLLLVSDGDVAAVLRDEQLGGGLTNFAPSSAAEVLDEFAASCAAGREHLRDSGLFGDPRWQTTRDTLRISTADYPSLLLSFANAAAAPARLRQELHDRLPDRLRSRGIETVDFDHHGYGFTTVAN